MTSEPRANTNIVHHIDPRPPEISLLGIIGLSVNPGQMIANIMHPKTKIIAVAIEQIRSNGDSLRNNSSDKYNFSNASRITAPLMHNKAIDERRARYKKIFIVKPELSHDPYQSAFSFIRSHWSESNISHISFSESAFLLLIFSNDSYSPSST